MVTLTKDEEIALENASEWVARKIVAVCSKRGKDVEGCVASRAAGLQYIEDIITQLPENHPLKIDDEQIYNNMTSVIKIKTMSEIQ